VRLVRLVPLLLVALLLTAAPAGASERVHIVQKGQRLGSIAKRYNVSIEALCAENGISRRSIIRPGQKLVIPGRGGKARAEKTSRKRDTSGRGKSKAPAAQVHTVIRGQRLGSIAKRYGVTVDAICQANGIGRKSVIKPGQRLVIPGVEGRADAQAPATKSPPPARSAKAAAPSWEAYSRPPKKRGYISLRGYRERWTGYVIGPKNQVLGGARRAVSRVLLARQRGHLIDRRLVQLIARVSDQFGGRTIEVVSGYRTKSWVKDSRHKHGQAIDFRIVGVPNEVLRDYLRTLRNVGVGYYPNSSFVHLDVRSYSAYWVDYSGPGEAPERGRASASRDN